MFGQIWDYFLFMWNHTKPYFTATVICIMTINSPLQTFLLGYITNEIVNDPSGVPLWLYFMPFFLRGASHLLHWWYQYKVPLNSQRYQLRCVLLTQRVNLSESHPLARKWTPGRFDGLLKDVDELVNGVWKGCLQIIELTVTVFWTLILCMINLAADIQQRRQGRPEISGAGYGIYLGVFLGLGVLVLSTPFLWFRLFSNRLSECEDMVQKGQALYLSTAGNAVADADTLSFQQEQFAIQDITKSNLSTSTIQAQKQVQAQMTRIGRESFKVYALTTFRSFFFRLAWTTNYDLLFELAFPFAAYGLLTQRGFGSYSLTSTIIILRSLSELVQISGRILSLLTVMAKGCLVLCSVAELLNANVTTTTTPIGTEKGLASTAKAETTTSAAQSTETRDVEHAANVGSSSY